MRNWKSLMFVLGGWSCLMLAVFTGSAVGVNAGENVARVTPSGDGIELDYTDEAGKTYTETLPLHHAGRIRYFSTGVGLEERAAKYPPFPLKLIFVAGAKAYVSRVSITIADEKGAVQLQIPGDQVTGPWLFVDLPAGLYRISASRDGRTQVAGPVAVGTGGQKTVYLRWEEASS